ncbi:hypothetical protein Tco_0682093 [Tanacetum coccineum]|uniref:Protein kinase-like domain, concanavalin A-like lectin/glucanase domain protein n=1 Tax=Tanacetum coccineum TaxID=301880 RepID=A0ABQ4XQF1_9ASTR
MEDHEQAFVEYASSRTDEAGEGLVSNFMASQDARLSKFEADFKQQQSDSYDDRAKEKEEKEKDSPKTIHANPSTPPDPSGDDREVMFIEIIRKNDDSRKEGPEEEVSTTIEGVGVEYFDTFPTRSELAYHKENSNRGVSNFTGRIKGMYVFIRNFTYVIDFMIVEDISSIIDPRLSQVVLGRPFVEISNMTIEPPECVVRFTNKTNEVSYKMPHKIEQYNSLADLEKEHTKSVYLRNEEDKRRGAEYVMRKILGFYKECLEFGPEYLTGMDDEGEVT